MARLLILSLRGCFISGRSLPAVIGRPCGFPSAERTVNAVKFVFAAEHGFLFYFPAVHFAEVLLVFLKSRPGPSHGCIDFPLGHFVDAFFFGILPEFGHGHGQLLE